MESTRSLGEERVGVLLWRFSAPAVVGMMVNALHNIVDSIFVGRGVGDIALAAVTLAFPIMLVLMGFGMLVGVGAATLVSIRLGQRRPEAAERILGNALALCVIMGSILGLAGILFLDPLLIALGADRETLAPAREFTRVILAGGVFTYIGFGLNSIVRAEGSPRNAMLAMIVSAALNMILNPIFIFGLGMGVAGSATATVLSQAVASLWVIAHFLRPGGVLKLKAVHLKPDLDTVAGIFRIGVSPLMMQVAAAGVSVVFNYSLLAYGGELAVASIGIINRVAMFILMPIFGINQGAQPIIGYNYGARKYGRVVETLRSAILAATAVALAGFAAVQAFDREIVGLFNANPDLLAVGTRGLKIYLVMLPLIGFQIVSANYFQAVGKAAYALMLSLSRQVFLLVPLVIILPRFFGINGVWAAGALADAASSLITAYFLTAEIRRLAAHQAGPR